MSTEHNAEYGQMTTEQNTEYGHMSTEYNTKNGHMSTERNKIKKEINVGQHKKLIKTHKSCWRGVYRDHVQKKKEKR